jgi:MoxR-like ATPase
MKIGQLKHYIKRHYFSKQRGERRYGLLVLGAPGVGKSTAIEEAGREIAKQLGKTFIKVVVRWSSKLGKFVINKEGEWEIEKVLADAESFFVFTDFRLSTCEPSDLSGPLRSREGIAYYDPLLWAVLHSANPGILLLDEITWIQREDVWAVTPQLVLDKIAGITAFHGDTLVIAAGNRPEDAGSLVRMIHNPLLNRFKIIRIIPSTVDEWAEYMQERFGDDWDKRVYSFLKRFSDEEYLLRVPNTPEGLENFPTPRSWTWVALDLREGFYSLEDLTGLVGEEVGRKFDAFLKNSVDLEKLIRDPAGFYQLGFDAKYMVPIMLASWVSQNMKGFERAFPLIDVMSGEAPNNPAQEGGRHEFLTMMCVSMNKKNLVTLLKSLFQHNPSYREVLSDIALTIKDEISV